jgi:hypothetical protein
MIGESDRPPHARFDLMLDLDEVWGILVGYGLGKELGAIPIVPPGSGLAAKFTNPPSTVNAFQQDHEPCN